MQELKSDGWKDLDLSTREKDVIALLNSGNSPKDAAIALREPVAFVMSVIQKIKASFDGEYLNMSRMDRESARETKFRKIVNSAMEEENVIDIDDKSAFMNWAIGSDYATTPYQEWPLRISSNVSLVGIDRMSPVKAVIRAACQIWKQKRIFVGVH
jgi:hypothetical protein